MIAHGDQRPYNTGKGCFKNGADAPLVSVGSGPAAWARGQSAAKPACPSRVRIGLGRRCCRGPHCPCPSTVWLDMDNAAWTPEIDRADSGKPPSLGLAGSKTFFSLSEKLLKVKQQLTSRSHWAVPHNHALPVRREMTKATLAHLVGNDEGRNSKSKEHWVRKACAEPSLPTYHLWYVIRWSNSRLMPQDR